MRMQLTVGIFALLIFSHANASQMKTPIIAVTVFDGRKVDSADAVTISDALSDHLLQTKKVRVIERSQINQILVEQGFQNSGACDNQSCAIEIGKLLGANRIVIGSISKIGRTYVLQAKLVEVQTGEVIRSTQKSTIGRIESVLLDIVPDVANDLVGIQRANKSVPNKIGGIENAENQISADAELAISEVANVGIVACDKTPKDSLLFSPSFYVVNNSARPITIINFSFEIPKSFNDAILETRFAPSCESMLTSSETKNKITIGCKLTDLDQGGVWPSTPDGIKFIIRSASNKNWNAKHRATFTNEWQYHKDVEIIAK